MKERLFKVSVLAVLAIAGSFLVVQPLRSQEKKQSRDNWTWINSDNDKKIEVKVENKVEFNEDYPDVASMAADGALRVYDSRGAHTPRLVVLPGGACALRRDSS